MNSSKRSYADRSKIDGRLEIDIYGSKNQILIVITTRPAIFHVKTCAIDQGIRNVCIYKSRCTKDCSHGYFRVKVNMRLLAHPQSSHPKEDNYTNLCIRTLVCKSIEKTVDSLANKVEQFRFTGSESLLCLLEAWTSKRNYASWEA